jgi:hypothetical protein
MEGDRRGRTRMKNRRDNVCLLILGNLGEKP